MRPSPDNPTIPAVRRIADALEVSVADLAAEVEDLEEDLEG